MPAKPRTLISREEIERRVRELGEEITGDYQGRELVMVGILKGAFVVMADLVRCVDLPARIDFMAVSSYGMDTRSSGEVSIVKDLDLDIRGRDLLVVEDIVDSGLTLDFLLRSLKAREPASLALFALLDKVEARKVPVEIRYRGFEVPDRFIVGYGLDCAERYRELPYIGVLEEGEA
jgi:hypoxanthine phosphoribosyltransferase